jgi:hypothetical protein
VIDGVVRGVMESFPLQLQVESDGRIRQVALGDGTRVSRDGAEVDPGTIMPGDRVRISGQEGSAEAGGFLADVIEVLG